MRRPLRDLRVIPIQPPDARVRQLEPSVLPPRQPVRLRLRPSHRLLQRQLPRQVLPQLAVSRAVQRPDSQRVARRRQRLHLPQEPASIIRSTRSSIRRYSASRGIVRPRMRALPAGEETGCISDASLR